MRKRSLVLLTGVFVLVASLVVGPSATAKSEGVSAGTVVIVHDQEPGILNNYLSEGNGYTVSLVMNPILAGGVYWSTTRSNSSRSCSRPSPSCSRRSRSRPPRRTSRPPDGATAGRSRARTSWPRTGRVMNPNWDITSREGWQDIAKIQAKGKSFTVTFKPKRAYAAWELILGASPLPAHKVAGQDFNKLWSDSIDISSGPFKFQSWQKGTQLYDRQEHGVQGWSASEARSGRLPLHHRRFAVSGAQER